MNRITFISKKDRPNIAFKSLTAHTNIFYAKKSWRYHYVHAISWAPQTIKYMTVNVLHAMEQSDNFKKTVAEVQKHLNPLCLQCWKRDTSNSVNVFTCWVILHVFWSLLIFSKLVILKHIPVYHQNVKLLQSSCCRSDLALNCSRRHNSPLTRKELISSVTLTRRMCGMVQNLGAFEVAISKNVNSASNYICTAVRYMYM